MSDFKLNPISQGYVNAGSFNNEANPHEEKGDRVSKESFKSPTFWSKFLRLESLSSRIYEKASSLKKNIKYRISLIYTLSLNYFFPKKQPWYSEISDREKGISNIYLGGIPLQTKGHLKKFKELQINSILSLLEPFEYQETFFSKPVTTQDWEQNDIKQKKIEAKDFKPLESDEIEKGVKFLQDQIAQNNTVYVHCKAGKGRSVTVVCCYLISDKNMSADDAIAFVKTKRSNINLNNAQIAKIHEYETKNRLKNKS